ncbi:uncharacterized protein LOC143360100 [Halictus rubicundus]|uniref:uncharacterized protein LOC143360100 n=1 Tax=Halictus rubicundus TaxID=77578 RepID=UPI0040360CED
MDTSTCSFGSQSALQSNAQRKFYQWVLRWISGMQQTNVESNDDSKHNSQSRLDVPILASFFQAIGFKLLSLDSNNCAKKKDETSSSTSEPGTLKVTIECGTSKMKAILKLGDVTCRCPNSDHVNDASFWSISGTAPLGSTDNIARNVEETGSNLLPTLPKDVIRVLRDVSQRLFETITCEPDMNRNIDTSLNVSRSSSASNDTKSSQGNLRREIGVSRSYTQPEICLRNSNRFSINEKGNDVRPSISQNASTSQPKKQVLERQRTWDIDIDNRSVEGEPRPSPPKITSSPTVPDELSQSLGQLSIVGEENSKNLAEYIIGAKNNLEKALKMLTEKSVASTDVSINQDDCASVKSAPAKISSAAIVTPLRQTRSNTISGFKPSLSSNRFTKEMQALVKPAPRNSLQTTKAPRASNPVAPAIIKRNMQIEQENVKPPLRRRSFYIPSSSPSLSLPSKPIDIGQKLPTNGKSNVTIPSATRVSNSLNSTITKIDSTTKTRVGTPSKFGALNSSGRISMLKPPTKVSKAIPVIISPGHSSKLSPGIAKSSRHSLSKE